MLNARSKARSRADGRRNRSRRAHLGGGPAAYHLSSAGHGHLVCEQCGATTEVPTELFGDLAAALADKYAFAVDAHRFAVKGRCAACQ